LRSAAAGWQVRVLPNTTIASDFLLLEQQFSLKANNLLAGWEGVGIFGFFSHRLVDDPFCKRCK
jgi:hypothetical protein